MSRSPCCDVIDPGRHGGVTVPAAKATQSHPSFAMAKVRRAPQMTPQRSNNNRSRWFTRRSFLYGVAAVGGSLVAAPVLRRPALADTAKPVITHGVQSGDILTDRAIVWS